MIYLDNAATSYPKPDIVYAEMLRCMKDYCANPGRGGHQMSIESGKAVLRARETVAEFFNIPNPMQLVFTKNATEALNIAIKGVLKPGDHVITTGMEHNSVNRPLKTLERDIGIRHTVVKGDAWGEVDPEDIRKVITPETKLIACTLSSNVNGIIMPVWDIGRIASESNILYLIDASQGAGSIKLDIKELKADMLAVPGHKGLLGPQGTGALYVSEGVKIKSLTEGGTGSNSEDLYQPEIFPDLLESGTLNTSGIVGLGFGIEYINSVGIDNINKHKHMLVEKLHEGLSEIKSVKLYSRSEINKNSGIAAFNFEGVESTETSYILDKIYGIASRAGLHCAPTAHNHLGTLKTGIVRLSVSCFNTLEEVEKTIISIKEISESIVI
ncbi:MAG: aminotransferase class V-fold PLP-dependent enzyme [Clostridiaceae bacterium]|nr:aminotransferase class V-fold PLP-dependent enzyme [Clostridiaceae bacterium]